MSQLDDKVSLWQNDGLGNFTQTIAGTLVPGRCALTIISVVAGAAVVLGTVVSAVPAWRAGRHDPLQSLREE